MFHCITNRHWIFKYIKAQSYFLYSGYFFIQETKLIDVWGPTRKKILRSICIYAVLNLPYNRNTQIAEFGFKQNFSKGKTIPLKVEHSYSGSKTSQNHINFHFMCNYQNSNFGVLFKFGFYPLASKASSEKANLTERKNPHTLL